MTRKYRAPLLAAAMALILGNSASAAERATGLYFEATVGMASADLGSKSELDQSFTGPIVEDLLDDGFEDVTFESSLDDSVYGALGVERAVSAFVSFGSTGPAQVEKQIRHWKTRLGMPD